MFDLSKEAVKEVNCTDYWAFPFGKGSLYPMQEFISKSNICDTMQGSYWMETNSNIWMSPWGAQDTHVCETAKTVKYAKLDHFIKYNNFLLLHYNSLAYKGEWENLHRFIYRMDSMGQSREY